MNGPQAGSPRGGFRERITVLNDAGASIPRGTPVALSLDGTDDGLAVKLPSGLSQDLAGIFFAGVVTDTIAAGQYGDAILFGIHQKAILRRATRAANTDNWAGSTSIAKSVLLSIDTVNNCFSTAAASQTNDSNTSITTFANRKPFAFLANDVASFASTDSTATSNGTALTIATKVFVRGL